jgi:hypothetical protein
MFHRMLIAAQGKKRSKIAPGKGALSTKFIFCIIRVVLFLNFNIYFAVHDTHASTTPHNDWCQDYESQIEYEDNYSQINPYDEF